MAPKPRPQKRKAPDAAKKAFHLRKLVRKAVRKARDFEVRKLKRKLKQVQDGGPGGWDDSVQKLEAQIDGARTADLDRLSAAMVPFLQDTAAGGAAGSAAATSSDTAPLSAVEMRICSAKCVSTQVAAAQQAFQQLQTQAEQPAAAAAAAARGPSVQYNGAAGPRERGPELDATASNALHKLLLARQPQAAAGSDSDDSGLFELGGGEGGSDELGSDSEGGEADEAQMAVQLHGQQEVAVQAMAGQQQWVGSQRGGKQVKIHPKKNRLGQRARRRLAEQQQQRGRGRPGMRQQQLQQQVILQQETALGKSAGSMGRKQQQQQPAIQEQVAAAADHSRQAAQDDLHPSWVAKKRQKVHISAAAPAGQKITFEESD